MIFCSFFCCYFLLFFFGIIFRQLPRELREREEKPGSLLCGVCALFSQRESSSFGISSFFIFLEISESSLSSSPFQKKKTRKKNCYSFDDDRSSKRSGGISLLNAPKICLTTNLMIVSKFTLKRIIKNISFYHQHENLFSPSSNLFQSKQSLFLSLSLSIFSNLPFVAEKCLVCFSSLVEEVEVILKMNLENELVQLLPQRKGWVLLVQGAPNGRKMSGLVSLFFSFFFVVFV